MEVRGTVAVGGSRVLSALLLPLFAAAARARARARAFPYSGDALLAVSFLQHRGKMRVSGLMLLHLLLLLLLLRGHIAADKGWITAPPSASARQANRLVLILSLTELTGVEQEESPRDNQSLASVCSLIRWWQSLMHSHGQAEGICY